MFANMKIGLRLTLGFAIVLVLMAGLAAIGINGMSTVEGRLDEIVNDNMYKVKLNNDMAESVHIVSRVVRTIVLLNDKAAQAAEHKKIEQARKKYSQSFEALEKTAASEKGKGLRARIKAQREEAASLNDNCLLYTSDAADE